MCFVAATCRRRAGSGPGRADSTVIELAIEPKRLAPADDAGDRLLVHAVLQRHAIAVRRQVLLDHRRRPGRVVRFGADEGDVERLLLADLLQLGDVQRAHRHGERLDLADMGDRQPVLLHVLDMLGPEIDKGHVLAGLDHVRPGIAADRPGAHDCDLVAHSFPPALRTHPAQSDGMRGKFNVGCSSRPEWPVGSGAPAECPYSIPWQDRRPSRGRDAPALSRCPAEGAVPSQSRCPGEVRMRRQGQGAPAPRTAGPGTRPSHPHAAAAPMDAKGRPFGRATTTAPSANPGTARTAAPSAPGAKYQHESGSTGAAQRRGKVGRTSRTGRGNRLA